MQKLSAHIIRPILFSILVILAGCSQGHYVHIVGGRTFTNAEEARAYRKNQIELDLAAITPSKSPIGDAVLVVLPPREQIREASGYSRSTGIPSDFIEASLDRREDIVLIDFEVVRRSKLFDSVELLRARTAVPSMAPAGGYLIWTQIVGAELVVRRYILESGRQDFHRLPLDRNQPVTERIKSWLAELRAYMEGHPPSR